MPRTTRDLLRAKGEGAVIRVFDPENEDHGKQVLHDPEKPRDRKPWRLVKGEARFEAWQLRPEGLHGGPWALARRLRINVR